jgi:hypothetical protein
MPALWRVRNSRLRKPRIFLPVFTGLLCLPLTFVLYLSAAPHPSTTAPHPSPVRSGETAVSATDTNLLIDAEQALIRDCMRRHGFQYWPLPASQAYPVVRFPYVITSVSWARSHGFNDSLGLPVNSGPNQRYYSKLSGSEQSAYANALVGKSDAPSVTTPLPTGGIDGHSADGCQASADTELYGSYQAWFKASTVALDLPVLWQSMVTGSRQYISAVSVWSACMREKGYRYSSPAEAASASGDRTSLPPRPAEITAALAEVHCAYSTGLIAVANRLDREFKANVMSTFRSYLNAEWRLERNALPRARRIVRS